MGAAANDPFVMSAGAECPRGRRDSTRELRCAFRARRLGGSLRKDAISQRRRPRRRKPVDGGFVFDRSTRRRCRRPLCRRVDRQYRGRTVLLTRLSSSSSASAKPARSRRSLSRSYWRSSSKIAPPSPRQKAYRSASLRSRPSIFSRFGALGAQFLQRLLPIAGNLRSKTAGLFGRFSNSKILNITHLVRRDRIVADLLASETGRRR